MVKKVGGAAGSSKYLESDISRAFFFFFFFPCFFPLDKLTFDMFQKRNHSCHWWHRQLAHAPRRNGLLQREARPMAYRTLLLHLDELAEIGESSLHLRVQSS